MNPGVSDVNQATFLQKALNDIRRRLKGLCTIKRQKQQIPADQTEAHWQEKTSPVGEDPDFSVRPSLNIALVIVMNGEGK